MKTYDYGNIRVLEVDADGPLFASERDANDIIGASFGEAIDLVAIPASRLAPDFFRLRTGLAGAFIQKFVTYGFRIAIVGDIGTHVAASDALRDFVIESNRGTTVWFVADMAELEQRLTPPPPSSRARS